jgi:N-acetylglucosamine-6-phosphate deacetylase
MQLTFPGFFDLQVNGFAGVDFNDPRTSVDDVERAIQAMRQTGVTRFLPTLITSSFETFAACAKTLTECRNPAIAGIHMEGPYISPFDGPRGAHPQSHVIAASIEDFERRHEAAQGCLRLVTLAPEVEGAIALIEHLVANNIRVAIGHTQATPEQIREAVRAGATFSTHLGNGCANLLPRHPNFIWEQLATDELQASFIADGHHLPPATLKAMMRAKSASRSVLVTDAIAAADCTPGQYVLGETAVELTADGRVTVPGKSWLAGSALRMNEAVGNTVRFTGFTLAEVLAMATTIPAEWIGLPLAGCVTADWDETNCRLTILSVADSAD